MPSNTRPRRDTLAWLATQAAQADPAQLVSLVEEHFPEAGSPPYEVMAADEGRRADRADLDEDDSRITYLSYDPPSLWSAPYSILRVRFESDVAPYLVHHPGEEIVAPVSGSVVFDYAWPDEELGIQRRSREVPEGGLARISPQIPHNARSGTAKTSEAWVVFRDLSDVPASISITPDERSFGLGHSDRRVTLEELARPERYALIAWGLAQSIREQRERVGYTRGQLAQLCDLDPSQISKLEQGRQNLSVASMRRILTLLGVPLSNLVRGATWFMGDVVSLDGTNRSATPPAPPNDHLLHPSLVSLEAGARIALPRADTDSHGFESYVVLTGELLVRFSDGQGRVASEGAVVHLHRSAVGEVEALSPTKVLRVVCSARYTDPSG